jgi:hypothetical protein
MANLASKKQHKKKIILLAYLLGGLFVLIITLTTLALSPLLYFKDVKVTVSNAKSETESEGIKKLVTNYVLQDVNTINRANFFVFDEDNLKQELDNSGSTIAKLTTYKGFDRILYVSVDLYKPVFVGCSTDPEILITCMSAGTDGVFKEESENGAAGMYTFNIDTAALSWVDETNTSSVDSLAGTRLYDEKSLATLFEFIKYFEKSGYLIKSMHLSGQKIAEIATSKYTIVVSLEKGFANTVKEFEYISGQDPIKSHLEKAELRTIDLSYRDKIFFKLIGTSNEGAEVATSSATVTDIIQQ